MSNHTPGTWTVCSDPSLYGGYIIEQAAREQNEWVAEGYEISDAEGDRRGEVAAERDQANAILIGAAADLLAFAEVAGGLIAWAADHGADKAAMRGLDAMRRKAVAKASTESHPTLEGATP
ncbi:MAG: hypothetical protein ACREA0_11475 [bacterium]